MEFMRQKSERISILRRVAHVMMCIVAICIMFDIYDTLITKTTESDTKPIEVIVSFADKPTAPAIEPTMEIMELPTEAVIEATEPQVWWTDEELDMLAALIYYEAGSNECTDRHQQLVGAVVMNRVASSEFPNTIYDVITQTYPGIQYSTYKLVLRDMGTDVIPERCYENALAVLRSEVDCPSDVVWQANFIQGSKIYEEIYTSYSVSYFCHR